MLKRGKQRGIYEVRLTAIYEAGTYIKVSEVMKTADLLSRSILRFCSFDIN